VTERLKPLSAWPRGLARGLAVLFTDIDDTVSSGGRITEEAYGALWRAREAGLTVVPVTGRPAGWCDHIARMWPVDGVIGENGGLVFRMEDGRMARRFLYEEAARADFRARLEAVREDVLRRVPGAAIASDQAYREYDLAVDFCEDVPRLPLEEAQRIKAIFEEHGATAKISSIHVNGWFGDFDKVRAARSYAAEILGLDPVAERDRCAFCGDSPNDEPMFAWLEETSVGVANLRDFLGIVAHRPAFLAEGRSGAGFAQLVACLTELRKG
jgi:HAD superfamily hydrolase (TIGR01484 family)